MPWCREKESNLRPTFYKSDALTLSYPGLRPIARFQIFHNQKLSKMLYFRFLSGVMDARDREVLANKLRCIAL